jgi:TonB family protein
LTSHPVRAKAGSMTRRSGRTFAAYTEAENSRRPWLRALFGSTLFNGVLAALLLLLGTAGHQIVVEREIPLTFVEKVPLPEPPPPKPAPPQLAAPQPAPAAAPVVPPKVAVRKLDKPPPAKPLVAPQKMPEAPPKEAEPSQDKGIAVVGEPGPGDSAGLEGGISKGVAGGQVGIVELPEGAVPPRPLAGNAQPRYPSQARRMGKTALVVLRVVILADGKVSDIKVNSGDEPFVTAAVRAVKQWRYQPARHQGLPIAVYRELRIRFELES